MKERVETVKRDLGLTNKAGRIEMARRLRDEQGVNDIVGGVGVYGTAGDANIGSARPSAAERREFNGSRHVHNNKDPVT